MEEQLSTRTEFKHKIQLGFGLESVCELDDKRVLNIFEDGSLCNGVLNLILLNEMLLLQGLDSVDVAIIDLLRQEDLTVRARTNHLHKFEVVNGEGVILDL